MKVRTLLPGLFALILALPARSADKAKQAAAPAPDAAKQAMMAKWAAAASPGAGQKVLDALAGSWDYSVEFRMAPGAAPETSTGTSEAHWIMGGRFLQQTAAGTSMGQPFEGLGLAGFNNVKGQYETVWIDNMGTAMMRAVGRYDAAAKAFTETGLMTDCSDGKDKPFRGVTTLTDPDHHTYELYAAGPDGKEFLCVKMSYARKKA